MKPEEDFAGRQIAGSRVTQDDYYGFGPLTQELDGLDGVLLVVADGMGGYSGGAIASRLVVESFVKNFYLQEGPPAQRLQTSLRAAEKALQDKIARSDRSLGQMGSTLVAAVCTGGTLQWASVGDSALYLFRDGALKRVNADHSMVPVLAQLVVAGNLTAEEAASHPQRNVLRAALTGGPLETFEISESPLQLQPGDIVIAASDGLGTVPPDALAAKIAENSGQPASRIAEVLLAAVSDARKVKQDNATVAVIRNPS